MPPDVAVLLLPGLYDSGPAHWQSHWESADARTLRVVQDDWATPRCSDWGARLTQAMGGIPSDVVLVGHSSSCALVAHWSLDAPAALLARTRGALLVAPSDPESPVYPTGPTGFAPVPLRPLPFPSIVVASDDDPYVALETARGYATAWGSRFERIGARGHINGDSGLGDWPEGQAWLNELCARASHAPRGA